MAPTGGGLVDGLGEGLEEDVGGVELGGVDVLSEMDTSSKDADAKKVATPIPPEENWVSVAVRVAEPLTEPVSRVPETVSEAVYQVPVVTVNVPVASVVEEPPTSFLSSMTLVDRRVR
jgi:hypothetical protein